MIAQISPLRIELADMRAQMSAMQDEIERQKEQRRRRRGKKKKGSASDSALVAVAEGSREAKDAKESSTARATDTDIDSWLKPASSKGSDKEAVPVPISPVADAAPTARRSVRSSKLQSNRNHL